MDIIRHMKSLSLELEALRDRVRNFNNTTHWLTDGEWKESVLRAVISAYLPSHIEPLRGFAVTPTRSTGQTDVLLYDNRFPVLFRNGDLVFVSPDAVVGIIEVKSKVHYPSGLRRALDSLAEDAEMIRSSRQTGSEVFVGLFAYETSHALSTNSTTALLDQLEGSSAGNRNRIVDFVSLGASSFAAFHSSDPVRDRVDGYDHWHTYQLDDMAAGYFVNNLVTRVAMDSVGANTGLWFPEESKETRMLEKRRFSNVKRQEG